MVKRVMIIAVVTAIIDGRMNALVQCGGCVELKTRWGRTVLWNTKLSHSNCHIIASSAKATQILSFTFNR